MTDNRFILWGLLCTSPTFRKWWIIAVVLYATVGGPSLLWLGAVVDQNGSPGGGIMIALAVIIGYLWAITGFVMWIVAAIIAWMYRKDYED